MDAEPNFVHPDNYINIDQQITPDIQDQLNIDFYKDKINQSKDYYSHKQQSVSPPPGYPKKV